MTSDLPKDCHVELDLYTRNSSNNAERDGTAYALVSAVGMPYTEAERQVNAGRRVRMTWTQFGLFIYFRSTKVDNNQIRHLNLELVQNTKEVLNLTEYKAI